MFHVHHLEISNIINVGVCVLQVKAYGTIRQNPATWNLNSCLFISMNSLSLWNMPTRLPFLPPSHPPIPSDQSSSLPPSPPSKGLTMGWERVKGLVNSFHDTLVRFSSSWSQFRLTAAEHTCRVTLQGWASHSALIQYSAHPSTDMGFAHPHWVGL